MKSKEELPIEKILNSIDGMHRAEIPAFFYTRLQAKIESLEPEEKPFWQFITKPAFSLVALTLMLLINIAAINYYVKNNKQVKSQSIGGYHGFAEEYDLTVSSVYTHKSER